MEDNIDPTAVLQQLVGGTGEMAHIVEKEVEKGAEKVAEKMVEKVAEKVTDILQGVTPSRFPSEDGSGDVPAAELRPPTHKKCKLDCRLHGNSIGGMIKSVFHATHESVKSAAVPASVDLRASMPAVLDQGNEGSCVSNATANALEYCMIQEQKKGILVQPMMHPARNYIYYNGRVNVEGSAATEDTGLAVADGYNSVARYHACSEALWPYDTATFFTKPSQACYDAASKYNKVSALKVAHDLASMKHCLAQGYPFTLGYRVYASFMTDKVASSGIAPMPKYLDTYEGGHCVLCCGYSDKTKRFICQNSWGTAWGIHGYFEIPYDYLTSSFYASDFWTFRSFD